MHRVYSVLFLEAREKCGHSTHTQQKHNIPTGASAHAHYTRSADVRYVQARGAHGSGKGRYISASPKLGQGLAHGSPDYTQCKCASSMVHVRFGSRPPSWPQNEVKVLVDAESSLYSSSIETPGPARPWRENVLRPRSSAGLLRLYPFWILPSDLFPLLCLQPLFSSRFKTVGLLSAQPRAAASAAWGARCDCSTLSSSCLLYSWPRGLYAGGLLHLVSGF